MYKLNVEKRMGNETEIITLYAPESASEITLKSYVDYFLALQDHCPSFVLELNDIKDPEDQMDHISNWSPLDWQEYYIFLAQALSKLLLVEVKGKKRAVELTDLLQIKKGTPFGEQEEASLTALFALCDGVIQGHVVTEIDRFTYKGKNFLLPEKVVDNYGRATYAPNITTMEAIEALQLEHVFSTKNENGEFVMKDRKYHTDLGVMAVICRQAKVKKKKEKGKTTEVWEVNEQLPLEMNDRKRFIEQRMKFFENIPMDIALGVAFFLISSKQILLSIHTQAQRLKTTAALFAARKVLRR